MHSVISAFDSRDEADRALEQLVASGVPRHDVHIEHRELYGEGGAVRPDVNWAGMESEVAIDRGFLSSLGHFFTSILGVDHPSDHVDTYAQHVEQGRYVLVMDARDEEDARRAHQLLNGAGGLDPNYLHRPGQRPLREVVAARQRGGGITADRGDRLERDASKVAAERESERAMAQNDRVRPLGLPGDDELKRAPGMRYMDMDKDDNPR